MARAIILLCAISLGMPAVQQDSMPMLNERVDRASPDIYMPGDHAVLHDSTYLDSIIRHWMTTYHIPGAATLALKNGQIIWHTPFGYAYVDSIEVTDTTMFTVASISKTIVAWAIMQLWEGGLIDLDSNVSDYLPFPVIHPLYPDSAITCRMLMAHTSGLRDCVGTIYQLISWGCDSPIPLGQFLQDYLVPGGAYYNANTNFAPNPPGTTWEYCNVGAALLAYVVEYLADSFPVYCRDSIFDPLNMSKTCWFLSELDTMCLAMPYNWNGQSYLPYGHYGHPGYPFGFLRTNAPELARSLQVFMQHGQIDSVRILDSTTVEMMTTIQYPAADTTQGLIWYKLSFFGREIWGHEGGWGGICTFQFYCPAENTGVIVLTNMTFVSCWYGVYLIADEIFDYAAEYGIAEQPSEPLNEQFYLSVSPNPFTQTTQIRYSILDSRYWIQEPVMSIYDASGRLVKDFRITPDALHTTLSWDGRDDQNRILGNGVYFLKLRVGDYCATEKLLLIR